jgi:UDP-N-acetylmuramoyl-tripeptide--D-alanyl-D-alanine ligase
MGLPDMEPISLDEIRQITGALAGGADARVSSVCTDTRKKAADSLFIALRGENFDGHDFLAQAAAGGTAGAMIDRERQNVPPHLPLIHVEKPELST